MKVKDAAQRFYNRCADVNPKLEMNALTKS